MSEKDSVSSRIMRRIDSEAQDKYLIPSIILMENAGRSVADEIKLSEKSIKKARIAVLCGKGNNGGDGFVASRYLLMNSPALINVYAPSEELIKDGPAKINFNILKKINVTIKNLKKFNNDKTAGRFTIIVDAILGTGFTGELDKTFRGIIEKANNIKCSRYAVDIPSGLDATTGKASKDSFRADKTITFGLAKKGFYSNDGKSICGKIVVKDIGFPKKLINLYKGKE